MVAKDSVLNWTVFCCSPLFHFKSGELTEKDQQMTANLSEAAALSVAQFDSLPDAAIIRDRGVAAVLSISRNSVWRWSREGRLPRPVKIGARTTGWRVGDLRAFLMAQG